MTRSQKQPYFDAFNELQRLKAAKCQPPQDVNRPMHPCNTPLKLYMSQVLPVFREKYPNKQKKDLEAMMAKQWKSMSESEKRPYQNQNQTLTQ